MFDFGSLVPIEYNNRRILTSEQLADGYGTTTRRISENFGYNKDRYELGFDYFVLTGQEKRDFISDTEIADRYQYQSSIYLWTESGALLHAKSLKTDQAWEVYKILMQIYFVSRENDWMTKYNVPRTLPDALLLAGDLAKKNEMLEAKIVEDEPKVNFYSNLIETEQGILSVIIAKEFGVTASKLHEILMQNGLLHRCGWKLDLAETHQMQGLTANGKYYSTNGSALSLWTSTGRDEIIELLLSLGYKRAHDNTNFSLV